MQSSSLTPRPLQVMQPSPGPPGGHWGSNPGPLALSNHDPHGLRCPRSPSPRLKTMGGRVSSRVLSNYRSAGGINYGPRNPPITLSAPCHHPRLPLERCVWRSCQVWGCPAPKLPPDNRLVISEILFQRILPPTTCHLLSATVPTAGVSASGPRLGGEGHGFPLGEVFLETQPSQDQSTQQEPTKCTLPLHPNAAPPSPPPREAAVPIGFCTVAKGHTAVCGEAGSEERAQESGSIRFKSPPRFGS